MIAPAELLLASAVANAVRVRFDEEGRDAGSARRPGPRHDDQHVGRAGAGDERLAAVEHVVIAVGTGGRAQGGGIGTGARLGQAVRGQQFARDETRCPARGNLGLREARHHPGRHVVDGQEGRRRGTRRGQLLEDHGRIEPRQSQATVLAVGVETAESQLAREAQRLAREMVVRVPPCRVRRDLLAGERPRGLLEGPLLLGELEVHPRAQRRLIVVLTPADRSSSNQRAVMVLVCV